MPTTPPVRRTDERQATFRQVGCARCAAVVLAAKFSPEHTSVQWTQDSVRACLEFAAKAARGRPTALVDTCASLWRSIEAAVRDGRLEVSPP